MAKVTRHSHPLMVEARKMAYNAGLGDGYKNGYTKGFEEGFRKGINGLERIKSVRLTVRENDDMPNYPSSVAIDFYFNEDGIGISCGFDKPTLTVAEVTETINELFEELLRRDDLWLKARNSIGSN